MAHLKVVHGSVWHDNKLYADKAQNVDVVRDAERKGSYGGDTIEFDETNPDHAETMQDLRRLGVAKFPEEILTAAEAQDLTAELQAAKDRQADLERQLAEALAAIEQHKSTVQ